MSITLSDRPGPVASAFSDDPDFAEILEFYLASMTEKHGRLGDMLRAGDFASLQREAHQIRGSAVNYGYPELSEMSQRLEEACQRADRESARRLGRDMVELIGRMTQP